jgi:hypothetical protein
MAELASRFVLSGVAGAVFIAAVDEIKVPPARAFDAVTTALVSGSGASTSLSQNFGVVPPPEIVVVDQVTGARRVGAVWLAQQRVDDRSKERRAEAGRLAISME